MRIVMTGLLQRHFFYWFFFLSVVLCNGLNIAKVKRNVATVLSKQYLIAGVHVQTKKALILAPSFLLMRYALVHQS